MLRSVIALTQAVLEERAPYVQPTPQRLKLEESVRSVTVAITRIELTRQEMAIFQIAAGCRASTL
jgi:hypothetical protein